MDIPYLVEARQRFSYTQALRRDFHKHPELGFEEVRTAGVVARELQALGLEVRTGMAETGVVALLEGRQPGPVVLLRFDMDALPIQEQTGAAYSSINAGVMHACGHDGHTAIGLTVAGMLQKHQDRLAGTVKFIFQPAEEIMQGAKRMVEEGVLQNPVPEYAISVHLWNSKPVGWIGLTPGPVMAAADRFRIRIDGSGGHAAKPNITLDPIVTAAQVVQNLQTVVSRNVSPLESAVLSVTRINGGETFNVIPAHVDLEGTIRSFEEEVRSLVIERMGRIIESSTAAMGCRADFELMPGPPSLVNDPELTRRAQKVVTELMPDAVLNDSERTMGSEDMAYIMQQIPGCYIFVGSANKNEQLDAPHHHPRFDFDEQALSAAVALTGAVSEEFLSG